MAGGRDRFVDTGSYLCAFATDVQVVCPRCGQRAFVRLAGDPLRRRLACSSCGYARDRENTPEVWGAPVDPWFGHDLWLRTPFGAHLVWAYGQEHARVLRDFVAAGHRQRAPTPPSAAGSHTAGMSMVERLPRWFKAAENRTALVRILDDLLALSS
jgi:ribosomal protein L37E